MAIVNKIDLKLKVNLDTCVMYQIMTYCFFKEIVISNSDLKFLMYLSKNDKKTITINKDMNIQKDGLVLLDYKILGNESKEV